MPKTATAKALALSPFNRDSVEVLWNTAKAEYDNEHGRTSVIDTKANVSLPIISAFFLALLQSNNYKAMVQLPTETLFQKILPVCLFCSYTLSLVIAILSVLFMTRVIMTRNYHVLNLPDLYDRDFLLNDPVPFMIQICKLYCEATMFNQNQNDNRVQWYRRSWFLMFFSLFFYAAYIIMTHCQSKCNTYSKKT